MRDKTARNRAPGIAIIGAGFGGLAVAQGLRKSHADVLLVDQRNHHLFQPMLYQVATGQLIPGDIAEPLHRLFARDPVVTPRMDAVVGIDLDARRIDFASGQSKNYDIAVLATGARFQYLGHPEWAQHVWTLKNVQDALMMRERIFSALERASYAESAADRRFLMSFVIVGAGPTGVELAGAMARLLPGIIRKQFPGLDAGELRLVLVDPKPHALASMDESLSRYADQRLEAMGVKLLTGTSVKDIGPGEAHLDDGRSIRASTLIWAAGVEGTGAGDWMPRDRVDKHNRIPVGADLTLSGHPEVFVIGDSAAASDEDGKPYPGLASVAKQQGVYVARVIAQRLTGAAGQSLSRFHFNDYGTMAMIANGSAVAEIRGHDIKGFVAWVLWGMVHLALLVSGRRRILVLAGWLWTMLAGRSQRVILGSVEEPADTGPPRSDGAA